MRLVVERGRTATGRERLAELIDSGLDYVEFRIRRDCHPYVYRLIYKCPPDELVLLRRFLSIPFGFLIVRFLLWAIRSFEFPPFWHRLLMGPIGQTLLVLIYCQSVQFRAVCWLVPLCLCHGLCRFFFYIKLVRMLFQQIGAMFQGNVDSLCSMASCVVYDYIQNVFRKIRIKIHPWFMIYNRTAEWRETLVQVQEIQQVSLNKAQNWLAEVNSQANISFPCHQAMEQARKKCQEQLSLSLNMGIVSRTGSQVVCARMVSDAENSTCQTMLELMKRNERTIFQLKNDSFNVVKMMENQMNDMLNRFRLTETLSQVLPSLSAVRHEVDSQATTAFNWMGILSTAFEIFFLAMLVYAVVKALWYHRRYLTLLNHDNFYIDRYFRHIDARRAQRHRIHLLPARGSDRTQLCPTWSPIRMPEELLQDRLQRRVIIIVMVASFLMLYLSHLTADLTDSLQTELARSDYVEIVRHSFQSRFSGGFIARQLDAILSRWRFDRRAVLTHRLRRCSRPSRRPGWTHYERLANLILVILVLQWLAVYLARLRHIVCDFFYYRQSKRRVLYLYNRRLAIRRRFLQYRSQQMEKLLRVQRLVGGEIEMRHVFGRHRPIPAHWPRPLQSFTRFWQRYVTEKCCFVCEQPVFGGFIRCLRGRRTSLGFVVCQTDGCRLIYCQPCCDDLLDICINCGRQQTEADEILVLRPG